MYYYVVRLANESGFGRNFEAMYKRCKEIDPTRIVHYEGDRETKAKTDIIVQVFFGRSNSSILLKKSRLIGINLISYANCPCMGNGPGGLKEYGMRLNN